MTDIIFTFWFGFYIGLLISATIIGILWLITEMWIGYKDEVTYGGKKNVR